MAIDYKISFPEPGAHIAAVSMELDPGNSDSIEIWMPVWTPGSYLVREYSRNVQGLSASDSRGNTLVCTKVKKNSWRIHGAGYPGPWKVTYELYCREKSVRTNWVDAEFALLNGASSFFTVRGQEHMEHRLNVELPEGWEQTWCPLPVDNRVFLAKDLDTLIDSPLLCGNQDVYSFETDDADVVLINQGESGLWDGEQACDDTEAIVNEYINMYGGFPCSRYLFYNLIVESRGGLEHKDCSVLMTSRYTFRDREAYISWLGLVSHEFFHVWNVKRSRPVELGPFDYENEVYTRSLWVAEGLTAYYTDLIPRRAGLTTVEEYLKTLSRLIHLLHSTPGRLKQSLEDSSFDAWIKLYRADENTPNSTVSYYLKGAVVGWLMDMEIQRRSRGTKNLDDVMRVLFERYSGDTGFTGEQVQQTVEEIAGESMEDFFSTAVRSTQELNFENALSHLGLRFAADNSGGKSWIGAVAAADSTAVRLSQVKSGSPAEDSGLNVEDEVLAVNGLRVLTSNFDSRLRQYEPGETVEFLVSRFDSLRTLQVTLGRDPGNPWLLELDPGADKKQTEARSKWLKIKN